VRRALLLVLLVVAGCASAPGGPAATIGKVRAWWQEICGLGDSALGVAEHAARAGIDAGPVADVVDASDESDATVDP
jgi:hypothetical protein